MNIETMPTSKDYAIEFGEYLAASAERFIAAVNSLECAKDADCGTVTCDETVADATAEWNEAAERLRCDIYEFRKRAKKAMQ